MYKNIIKIGIRAIAFLLIFVVLLSVTTMIFLPKRDHTGEVGQVAGFYREPDNTIDVLFLGSCNMYSSMSPVLMYESHGITGYCFCCPDQEMSTSYYYLKEALKTQDIKAVVVESLFLTETNNSRREHYNRFAFDYFPINRNKIELAWKTSKLESELMAKYDNTAPDTLLTFAGYIFPLMRYHGRTDLSLKDVTFFFEESLYNPYKGGFPQYTYTTNDDNYFSKVFNGKAINELSQTYIPMMKELCDEKGIPLIIAKSPNYARWGYDDTHTKIVRDFAEELDIPFLDFLTPENNNFEIYDYGYQTGRLNVYGVKKFSTTMGDYLVREFGLEPTALSAEDKAQWDACVEQYYQTAKEKDCSLYPGQIAQLKNVDGALCVRWNACDSETYSIYRCVGKEGTFQLLTDEATGVEYYDRDVTPAQGYTYYVVPNSGELTGQKSDTAYYVYVDMPQNFKAENVNGKIKLTWDETAAHSHYRISRRNGTDFNFKFYDNTDGNVYTNKAVTDGYTYYYRLAAVYKEDGVSYLSMTTNVRIIPQTTPVISKITTNEDSIQISWEELTNQGSIQIWRKSELEEDFTQVETLSGKEVSYTDKNVEPGIEYFYKIISHVDVFDIVGDSEPSNTVGAKIVQ